MEMPEPDPNKLLQSWMEWERGEVTPGRVMANLKTGGLRQLLEGLSAAGGNRSAPPGGPAATLTADAGGQGAQGTGTPGEQRGDQAASWSPVV